MMNFYDIAFGIVLGIAAPYWLIKPSARRKVLRAFSERMGRDLPAAPQPPTIPPTPSEEEQLPPPVVLIHAVSLGEMNATRALISRLREARADLRFVVSATTDTGFARGEELYGPEKDIRVIRYPLDFSAAIARLLDAIQPDVIVLMELEVWPNFMKQCERRGIPVVLANARLTPTSFRNYRLGTFLTRKMFRRLTLICAQEMLYAERFMRLGVSPHHIVVTGTMKFDNAGVTPSLLSAQRKAREVGLRPGLEPVWVCGSTGPGEEEIVLSVYRRLLGKFARLRLVIVPRKPERFDEVEQIILESRLECFRATEAETTEPPMVGPIPPVILVDKMGVLRDFYTMADVVFVGRSLVDLGPRQHGSDMIEPAAIGRPVIVGPFTANFAEAMNRLRESEAVLEVVDEESLEQAVTVMLSTPREAAAMGQRAMAVVQREQGATARHVRVILQVLAAKRGEEFSIRPSSPTIAAAQFPAAQTIGPRQFAPRDPAVAAARAAAEEITTLGGKPYTVGPVGGRGRIVIERID